YFQAEDGIRDRNVTGVQTCALPISNSKLAFYRLHGQNYSGWLNANEDPDWRKTRTLYDYSQEELEKIQQNTKELAKHADEVAVRSEERRVGKERGCWHVRKA